MVRLFVLWLLLLTLAVLALIVVTFRPDLAP